MFQVVHGCVGRKPWYRLCSHPVGLTEVLMPLVLMTSCCSVVPQDVWPAIVVPALLWVLVLSAQVVVFVEALMPIVLVIACLVTAIPVGIIAVVWVIPLCRVVILLLVCCIRQVVDCCSTVFGQVTWLATFVAYCYWFWFFPFPWSLAPLFFPCPVPVPFIGCHTCFPFTFPFALP